MGRSRDHWRKPHRGVILSSYCVWAFHIVWRLFHPIMTAHSPVRPLNDIETHFKWHGLLWLKQCKSFRLYFLEMSTLLPSYFKRSQLHFGIMHSVQTYIKWKLFDGTFCWSRSLRMATTTLCYSSMRAGHVQSFGWDGNNMNRGRGCCRCVI